MKPDNAATVTFVAFNAEPLMVNELAAVVVLIQTFPKSVNGEVRVNEAPAAGLMVNV